MYFEYKTTEIAFIDKAYARKVWLETGESMIDVFSSMIKYTKHQNINYIKTHILENTHVVIND